MYLFYDLETGSTDPDAEILSIGAAFTDLNYDIVSEFYETAKPLRPERIENDALAVNGFKWEDFDKSRPIPQVLESFWAWVEDQSKSPSQMIWSGFNIISFDNPILLNSTRMYLGQNKARKFRHVEDMSPFVLRKYRLMARVGIKIPTHPETGLPKMSLDTALRFFGVEPQGSVHNALTDVKKTIELCKNIEKIDRHAYSMCSGDIQNSVGHSDSFSASAPRRPVPTQRPEQQLSMGDLF